MTVYVDTLMHHGWRPRWARGKAIRSCHMFTDQTDLTELHELAARIGMKREWFQGNDHRLPHYDLTTKKRAAAIAAGAAEISRERYAELFIKRRRGTA